jgi:hypothetical protein
MGRNEAPSDYLVRVGVLPDDPDVRRRAEVAFSRMDPGLARSFASGMADARRELGAATITELTADVPTNPDTQFAIAGYEMMRRRIIVYPFGTRVLGSPSHLEAYRRNTLAEQADGRTRELVGMDRPARVQAYAMGYHEMAHHALMSTVPDVERVFRADYENPRAALRVSLGRGVSRYANDTGGYREGWAEMFTAAKVYGRDALPTRVRVAYDAARAMMGDRRSVAAITGTATQWGEAMSRGNMAELDRLQRMTTAAVQRMLARGAAVYRAAGIEPPTPQAMR